MKNMHILDLDDISTWYETYNKFVWNDPFGEVIEDALSQEADDKIQNILVELEIRLECVKSREVVLLRNRCKDLLIKNYTHVAAYHACRPTDINLYLSRGIVPANTEELIQEAKIIFGNADNEVDKAVKDIDEFYFDHGRGKIGFFMSRTGSVEGGYSHYLRYGSELFQSIANRLGNWAIQKLANRGTPTVFRCALPISWLDEFTTFPMAHNYAKVPLQQLLAQLRWPHQEFPICYAFLLTRSVPSEYLLEAIDMTQLLTEEDRV
jgi:hypothetical protein